MKKARAIVAMLRFPVPSKLHIQKNGFSLSLLLSVYMSFSLFISFYPCLFLSSSVCLYVFLLVYLDLSMSFSRYFLCFSFCVYLHCSMSFSLLTFNLSVFLSIYPNLYPCLPLLPVSFFLSNFFRNESSCWSAVYTLVVPVSPRVFIRCWFG